LQRRPQKPTCAQRKRRPKGWTPERRAQQAARIRLWQPWRRSTGPRSEAGKAQSSMNGLKHGGRSRAHIMEFRRIRYVLRLAERNIAILRTYNRITQLERTFAVKPQTPEALLKLALLRTRLAHLATTAPPHPRGNRFSVPSAVSS
jgi:hypothetical protein